MIRFVTQWFGLDTLAQEEFDALREPVEIAVTKATLYYEGKVKKKLGAVPARTGRMYGEHQASAPGEPPAPWSSDLRRSITHTPVMWEGNTAWAEVGTPLPYGKILEYGGVTSDGVRILARPYFSATWLEEEEHIQAILDRAVRKAPLLGDIVPVETGDEGPTGKSGRDRSAAAKKGWANRRAKA